MSPTARCPSCEALLRVPNGTEGKSARCPKCHQRFIIKHEAPGSPAMPAPIESPRLHSAPSAPPEVEVAEALHVLHPQEAPGENVVRPAPRQMHTGNLRKALPVILLAFLIGGAFIVAVTIGGYWKTNEQRLQELNKRFAEAKSDDEAEKTLQEIGRLEKEAREKNKEIEITFGKPFVVSLENNLQVDFQTASPSNALFPEMLASDRAKKDFIRVSGMVKNLGPRAGFFSIDAEVKTANGDINSASVDLHPYLSQREESNIVIEAAIPQGAVPVELFGTFHFTRATPEELRGAKFRMRLPTIKIEKVVKEMVIGEYILPGRTTWGMSIWTLAVRRNGSYEYTPPGREGSLKEEHGTWQIDGDKVLFHAVGREEPIKGIFVGGVLYYPMGLGGPLEGLTRLTKRLRLYPSQPARDDSKERGILQQITGPKEDPPKEIWGGTYIGGWDPAHVKITLRKDGTFEFIYLADVPETLEMQYGTWKIGAAGQNLRLFFRFWGHSPTEERNYDALILGTYPGEIIGRTLYLTEDRIEFVRSE